MSGRGTGRPAERQADWRVIAFTYNQTAQAQAKADRLAQRNPSLHLEVFSPRGHAPYLVAVNGFMTREQAMALRNKLRSRRLSAGHVRAELRPKVEGRDQGSKAGIRA